MILDPSGRLVEEPSDVSNVIIDCMCLLDNRKLVGGVERFPLNVFDSALYKGLLIGEFFDYCRDSLEPRRASCRKTPRANDNRELRALRAHDNWFKNSIVSDVVLQLPDWAATAPHVCGVVYE